jgi:hypothetical protein
VDLFLKICSESTVEHVSNLPTVLFSKNQTSIKKSVKAKTNQNGGQKSKCRQMHIFVLKNRLQRHLSGMNSF